jgi:hypothetical protein
MVVIFVPYPDIDKSLRALDMRRLGKQRVEASQIINALLGVSKDPSKKPGWRNHPATKMWEGHVGVLKKYYNRSLEIWSEKGGKNVLLKPMDISQDELETGFPKWWGWAPIHESHRAALVRKDDNFYGDMFGDLSKYYLERGYVWPVRKSGDNITCFGEPSDDMFDPINQRQLLPKCAKEGCSNPCKVDGYCGVHKRLAEKYKKIET